MKTTKKALLTVLCALLLVVVSVLGTIAYFTDSEAVTNTFTVGKVEITLDEAPVDANGKETAGARVKENKYHLIPGGAYDKDPTIHVSADSEDCYLYVIVNNGLKDIIGATTVEGQMAVNGWVALDGYQGVYYYTENGVAVTNNAGEDRVVFETFTISGDKVENPADGETVPAGSYNLDNYKSNTITVTAYAVQAAGFDTAADAWGATYGN